MYSLPPPPGASASVRKMYKDEADKKVPEVYREMLVVPLRHVPVRIAKFDVCLREQPLCAVHAMRTVLERMVMFHCTVCRERFATFHPAYDPTDCLDLQLTRRGADGVAACSLEVAFWEDVPPLKATPEELVLASSHEGMCRACHVDMQRQIAARGGAEDGIVPDVLT